MAPQPPLTPPPGGPRGSESILSYLPCTLPSGSSPKHQIMGRRCGSWRGVTPWDVHSRGWKCSSLTSLSPHRTLMVREQAGHPGPQGHVHVHTSENYCKHVLA